MLKLRSIPLAALWLVAFPLAATAATFDVAVNDNSFSPKTVNINVGDTVRWTNASGGNPHDVKADDGSFSNPEGAVPSFTYSLIFNSIDQVRYFCSVHGGPGGVGMSGTVNVTEAANQAPNAAFSSSCTNLDCNFTDQSTDNDGSIASRSWDFGDGTSSNAQNPAHSYAAAGTFAVNLTVTDNDGDSDSTSKNVAVTKAPFVINAAISDAWFFPDTAGQGFFIIVWEDSKLVFLAWFTYDTERPAEGVTAIFGEPGHRWITALGPFEGDTALLDIFLSSGMILDSAEPPVTTEQLEGATIEIVWSSCEEGILKYDIPSLGLSGDIPIQRIVDDNVAACEAAQP